MEKVGEESHNPLLTHMQQFIQPNLYRQPPMSHILRGDTEQANNERGLAWILKGQAARSRMKRVLHEFSTGSAPETNFR